MKENHIEKVKNYYNNVQKSYDILWMNKKNLAMHLGFWDENTKSQHEALFNENLYIAKALDIKKGDKVLDAGCGVGGTAIWIAEEYGAKVTGVSIMKNQIDMAKQYAKDRKVDHLVNFKVKDYIETGFPDESFDKIYAMESMCHAESKEDFIREMYRLLKPGGTIAIIDEFVAKEFLDKDEQRLLNDWLDGWAVPNMLRVEKFHEMFIAGGFKKLKSVDVTEKIMRSVRKIQYIGLIFYPFDTVLSKIGLVSEESFGSTVASIRQRTLFKKGIVIFYLLKGQK